MHERVRDAAGQETTSLELFFDLVYVLAVTQLSHVLIADLSLRGAWHMAFLLVVVWWAWVNTTWMLNWLDPDSIAVRLTVLAGALTSLLMAAALPGAFGTRSVTFVGGYVIFQVGRNLAGRLLTRGHALQRMFAALTIWSAAAMPFWVAGAVAHGTVRIWLWLAGLGIEIGAPAAGYRLPGRGRIEPGMELEGGHFADRFQGFVILALGESIVVTGATAAGHGLGATVSFALAIAFIQTGALWWLYFDASAVYSKRQMRTAPDAVGLARDAYTYLHLPIIAGVILAAVGDDVLLKAPHASLGAASTLVTLAGPIVYLSGTLAFRARMIGRVGIKRPVAIALLIALGLAAPLASALALAAGVAAVLVGLVAWERDTTGALSASQLRSGPG